MNKGPEVKETAFLYFHISLFACSHNTCSPASDENPLHSDTCDREANNRICGKYRKAVSFTSYCIGSARKRIVVAGMYWFCKKIKRNQNDTDKDRNFEFLSVPFGLRLLLS